MKKVELTQKEKPNFLEMVNNFLVIGSGAREHAIVNALYSSRLDSKIFCIGNSYNPGIMKLCFEYVVGDYNSSSFVVNYANKNKINYAIIGPENPLEAGISDALWEANIKVIGPKKELAKIETSKAFTRNLQVDYGIPGGPKFQSFTTLNGVAEYFEELNHEFVIKFDGLAGGKGVKVYGEHIETIPDALDYCKSIIDSGGSFLIEEKFIGEEFSLMSFCDGKNIQHMPIVQDHKRAYENDSGPNTGGMGTYSDYNHSLPFLNDTDIESAKKINLLTMEALKNKTGMDYIGILYGGFMAVKNGVRLIEYNARFGDPEAMNVLSILKTDFIDICKRMVSASLDKIKIEFENKATVCKYSVPNGYPDNPVKNQIIDISDIKDKDKVFYASVNIEGDNLIETGSRTLAVISVAETIVDAERSAEDNIKRVKGPVFHRSDIGTKKLVDSRKSNMDKIRC